MTLAAVALGGAVTLRGLHRRYCGALASNGVAGAFQGQALKHASDVVKLVVFDDGPTHDGNDHPSCLVGECATRRNDTYWYSREKGMVELSAASRLYVGAAVHDIEVRRSDLGAPYWAKAAGTDGIVVNAALQAFGAVGTLRADSSGSEYDLVKAHRPGGRWWGVPVAKVALVGKAAFTISSTSVLVSAVLRETQARMLRFGFLIKRRVSNRESFTQLVTTHLLDSVAFAPVMLGMLYFLADFFQDHLLALLVLTLFWAIELFSAVVVRCRATARHQPHLVMLYLLGLHVYIFAFPFGFPYVAFLTTTAAIAHALFFFWSHCELPALQSGAVSAAQPRELR